MVILSTFNGLHTVTDKSAWGASSDRGHAPCHSKATPHPWRYTHLNERPAPSAGTGLVWAPTAWSDVLVAVSPPPSC